MDMKLILELQRMIYGTNGRNFYSLIPSKSLAFPIKLLFSHFTLALDFLIKPPLLLLLMLITVIILTKQMSKSNR